MIEYKYNEEISVYFTPKDNGTGEYRVEVHDFANLDFVIEELDYLELSLVLKHPENFIKDFRNL